MCAFAIGLQCLRPGGPPHPGFWAGWLLQPPLCPHGLAALPPFPLGSTSLPAIPTPIPTTYAIPPTMQLPLAVTSRWDLSTGWLAFCPWMPTTQHYCYPPSWFIFILGPLFYHNSVYYQHHPYIPFPCCHCNTLCPPLYLPPTPYLYTLCHGTFPTPPFACPSASLHPPSQLDTLPGSSFRCPHRCLSKQGVLWNSPSGAWETIPMALSAVGGGAGHGTRNVTANQQLLAATCQPPSLLYRLLLPPAFYFLSPPVRKPTNLAALLVTCGGRAGTRVTDIRQAFARQYDVARHSQTRHSGVLKPSRMTRHMTAKLRAANSVRVGEREDTTA